MNCKITSKLQITQSLFLGIFLMLHLLLAKKRNKYYILIFLLRILYMLIYDRIWRV